MSGAAAGLPGSGLTAALAQGILDQKLAEIPASVRQIARLALLDWYAVSIAGVKEDPLRILAEEVKDEGGRPQATMLGGSLKTSATLAALYNGTAGHVLDYDDVHNAVPGHATINIAPAVIALGEARGASGPAVLDAFIAGFELNCRLGVLLAPHMFSRGWQGTAIGTIAAAAACGKLVGLDVAAVETAMALAAAQASGIHGNYGSMTKCLNVGLGARAGLTAAVLAERGFTAAGGILERGKGFAEVYAGGANIEAALAEPPGGFHLCRNLFKVHASCFLTHGALEAWHSIAAAHRLGVEDVSRVTVTVEQDMHRIVLTAPPRDGLEAKFNLKFCLAMAMHGVDTAAPESFGQVVTSRQDLHEFCERIDVVIDPTLALSHARLGVECRDGRRIDLIVDTGEPVTDLGQLTANVTTKARMLFKRMDGAEADGLIARLLSIDELASIGELHPRFSC